MDVRVSGPGLGPTAPSSVALEVGGGETAAELVARAADHLAVDESQVSLRRDGGALSPVAVAVPPGDPLPDDLEFFVVRRWNGV